MTLVNSVRNFAIRLSTISISALPMLALAQETDFPGVTGTYETGSDFVDLIQNIATWFAVLLFVVAVIFIIIAAFGYLTAGGDEEKVKSAKQKLVYAVVAVVVGALAFFIPRVVLDILNVQIDQP